MANLSAQIKDKFLGLVDRVTDAAAGFGRAAGGKDDDVQDPTATKLHLHAVQVIIVYFDRLALLANITNELITHLTLLLDFVLVCSVLRLLLDREEENPSWTQDRLRGPINNAARFYRLLRAKPWKFI